MLQKKSFTKKRENLIMYKKGFNTFCRKVDGSRDIERNAFSNMAATLISIRPCQSRLRLRRHPPTSPEIITCSLFFSPYISFLLDCDARAPHAERIFVGL